VKHPDSTEQRRRTNMDNVEEMTRKILDSGLVRKLEVPDPHLYFQAPGGQCLRLVGFDEDLSFSGSNSQQ
jgi:hypothetical protein